MALVRRHYLSVTTEPVIDRQAVVFMEQLISSVCFDARDVVRMETAINLVNLNFCGRNALFLIND